MEVLEGLKLGLGKKVPLLLQTEAAECGLVCLAMVAGYHGYRTDLANLRTRFAVSLKGLNLSQLIQIAGRMEMSCRPLRADLEALGRLNLPVILHWNLNHYVVLKQVRRDRLVIHDPALGLQILTYEEASKHFTGVALELEPTLKFAKREERSSMRLRGLMGRVRGLGSSLVQVLALALALEIFAMVGPFLMQWIVDDALVSGDKDLLTVIVTGILLLALLRTVVALVRSWVLLHLGSSLNLQWTSNVMNHLLRLPTSFFEKRHIGDIVSRFGAVSAIQQTLTTGLVTAILDGLMAVTTLVMMFIYSPSLAAIALGAVVLYGLLRLLRYDALRTASQGQIVRLARQQSHFMETVRGIQAIKLFNRQADRATRFLKMTVDSTNSGIEIQRLSIAFQAINTLLVGIEGALILWLGSRSVLDRSFTVGMLIAFISYKDQFTTRIMSLIDKGIDVRMLRLHAERLSDIVLAKPEPDLPRPFFSSETVETTIELRNIRFRYADGEPWIIDGLSLTIAKGESVVLVGGSGCGKTTLLKIMLGQLEPVEGEVLIGGIPLKQLGLTYYRSMIGVVMQDDRLFAGSLADNISFFDEAPDQQYIEECAKLARIHEEIGKMPMGYNSLVGDMGTSLSGGQKQRVVLARALYKRPSFIFLDEATSHLDTRLEDDINAAISRLSLTRVVVAHRPETIRASGRVVSLSRASSVRQATTASAERLAGTH
ncbi:peptidase domain-containing ABC transporter [Caenimonas terrae]|uniref:Peptidase domain-containing ABC transporter n=1 Tax=Caenimonas terrae TaxID=696074 RepID=A0ABW0NKI2_9BURK